MVQLLRIAEPRVTGSPSGLPWLRLGFRPFYLGASIFAVAAIPAWLLKYFSYLTAFEHLDMYWHMHEMIFGFAVAVVVGFLYTAGAKWTGLPTPRGRSLLLIWLIWLMGRIAMLLAPAWLASMIDIAFLPCASYPLYRVLVKSNNTRNLKLVGLLTVLALCNLIFHAAILGALAIDPRMPMRWALFMVVIIESIIGGRVIPMFTANALRLVPQRANERTEFWCMAITISAAIAWLVAAPILISLPLTGAAAVFQCWRALGWQGHRTATHPILWILHVSYAWIPLGFALMALNTLGWVSVSAVLHTLAVGSMAGLIIGMMTRTALGHTGRELTAGKGEIAMYTLIVFAALCRLLSAVGAGATRNGFLIASGILFSMAFAAYACVYAPILCSSRRDGLDG